MENCLVSLAKALKVPKNTIVQNESNYISQIVKFLESNQSDLAPKDFVEKAEVHQIIEYVLNYASHVYNKQSTNFIMGELNFLLAMKTYLIGYRLTIADVLIYYLLWEVLNSLSSTEREKYINVCRWFDNIQQVSVYRQSKKIIDFKTIRFVEIIPFESN